MAESLAKRYILLPTFEVYQEASWIHITTAMRPFMLKNKIFDISSPEVFDDLALKVFRYQYSNVEPYSKFCDLLKVDVERINRARDIPFLPIEIFKQFPVLSAEREPVMEFSSSGTTGQVRSKRLVADPDLYLQSFRQCFRIFYGEPKQYTILALLPSYQERDDSSLIYMVAHLIAESKQPDSGFYLNDSDALIEKLHGLEQRNKKVLLMGVSYALLDLLETHSFQLKNTIIMETGGMKGRRKEMIREALHQRLKKGFGVTEIHSEYGMTELFSQAYSKGNGIFECPPWMRVLSRDPENPLEFISGQTGGINVIDLANINACSFIATQDLGKVYDDGSFEILGRFDTSDIRGCNLMAL